MVKTTAVTINGMEVLSIAKRTACTQPPYANAEGRTEKIGEVNTGDKVLCRDEQSGKYETYIVWNKTETAGGTMGRRYTQLWRQYIYDE